MELKKKKKSFKTVSMCHHQVDKNYLKLIKVNTAKMIRLDQNRLDKTEKNQKI